MNEQELGKRIAEKVRVSISLDADDASFLHGVIANTGSGGPLWARDELDDDPVGDKHREAWQSLLNMLSRACDLHGRA